MKRRIISLILSVLMLISLIPISSVFAVGTTNIVISADKTTAYPNDIVNFTVSIKAVEHLMGAEFKVNIPSGMTYVAGSAAVADGLKTTLGCASADWTESSMKFTMYGDGDYSSNSNTKILTFSCKIDSNTVGSVVPQITDIVLSDTGFEEITTQVDDNAGTVTVAQRPVSATGVSLNKGTLSLNTGESETLIATVDPNNASNKTVSWKSSNTAIATVDNNGKVTATKKGTATITVTTDDGNFTDTCMVTVACSHANRTPVAEKASDCKNKGWDAYVKCDDCGQLFDENGTTEITEIPFRPLSQQHIGGTATCTAKAVCTVCNNPYGNLASHSYTATEKKAEALKTAGNCRDKAIYWYSCSACGNVEGNDNHTFNGDKVASNHVGGTTLVNPSEANHKTQTDGYTGDTKCLGCGEILDYGEPIPAGAHTPAGVWSNDSEYHWKECTVVGCGIVIDGSKAKHTSTGANLATCQKKDVCDVCNVTYGDFADHDWNTTAWEKDASGHWHKCNTAGCTEKNAFAGHTPDYQGSATEEYAIKCTVCQYEIEAQLSHTHVFSKEVAEEQYLATKANCIEPAKYYKSCKCGKKGTETFASGEALGHTEGTEWKSDVENHWHACSVAGCGVIIDNSKAAHTPDREEATETNPIKCSVCGYAIVPALGHTHAHGTEWKSDKDNHWNECACGDKANSATHSDTNIDGKCDVCEYQVGTVTPDPDNKPEDTNKPSDDVHSPQTGDNSMMWMWITLLIVSGFGMIATVVMRKKFVR